MRKRILLLLVPVMLFASLCRADEGMWIPMLLKKYNLEDMQKKGFKLTAEDIYAINQASLKDAVIGLGNEGQPFQHFCTGELISSEGLVVTNHHCAFGMIQAHTTLENNYLRDGFWAKDKEGELTNPGITASILMRMEDVTEEITRALTPDMTEQERKNTISRISKEIEERAVKGTNYAANVKPYFNGNQFFMSVFKIFKDVRLVGAPSSAIGKFGGDTDNWMWPRHTGDFSVLRIYADENNEPASFSQKNKPYRPESFFKISTTGLQEGDFTMIFGYPGTTREYLTSFAVEQLADVENPHKIAIRTAKLDIINAAMNTDELLRIKYAAKAAGIANSWKKWQGESKGLKRFKTVENKQKTEAEFQTWARDKEKYSGLIDSYRKLYSKRKDLILANAYLSEAGRRGAELTGFASLMFNELKNYEQATDKLQYKKALQETVDAFYKDYDISVDKQILAEMLKLYNQNLNAAWIPEKVREAGQKEQCELYAADIFKQSIFASQERLKAFISKADGHSYKKLVKDPAYQLACSMDLFYAEKIKPELTMIENGLVKLNRLWLEGLMQLYPDKTFYADANSTLRVSYGEIGGYSPLDGVYYKHYTTLRGIMEKDNPAIYDYNIPQKLRDVYQRKDFGKYTQDGDVPVCFIANNHTTGGNSGSPVLNAEGHLIGINFDRSWEGVMSDMQYDPEICRNIAVDIRYVLFVIDKIAGADHLLNEMVIVD